MMNSGPRQVMAMPNSFWPFAYPIKPYDLAIHPAFIPTTYRSVPGLPYGHTNNVCQEAKQKPADKFSIDAILNKDKVSERRSTEEYDVAKYGLELHGCGKDQGHLSHRRHDRMLESAHPYLSHPDRSTEKSYGHKHLQSPYKQFTENIQDKPEKKCSPGLETWTKQGKGKRVRTIFTPEQLERMEAEFERQQYMVGTERYYLASSLNLTEAQVKVWFQNRRIKWRKQHLEQQQAKLKSLDIFKDIDSVSDDELDDEVYRSLDVNSRDVDTHTRDVSMHVREMNTKSHDITTYSRDVNTYSDINTHSISVADPFQSPKESRSTQ